MFGGGIFRSVLRCARPHDRGRELCHQIRFGKDLTGLAGTVFNARFSSIGDNSNSGLAEAPAEHPSQCQSHRWTGNGKIDPLFGPLIDNGGPTLTHAIGSAAQRSTRAIQVPSLASAVCRSLISAGRLIRVTGGRIDIGAFELQPPRRRLPVTKTSTVPWNVRLRDVASALGAARPLVAERTATAMAWWIKLTTMCGGPISA